MQDINPQHITNVIRLLNEHGIQTAAIFEPIGCTFHPSPEDIIKMIQDSDAFFARECGLSKKDYQDWKAFLKTGCRCPATTRAGTQCAKRVKNFTELSPQRYVERRNQGTLFCAVHQHTAHS
ncbi:hypothetical protein [Spirochaeta africana]|uniref:Uncharacterized protein n=1 Tax=Spirochaeta africana (strain ATCC 700263 / DSM 8902 / Z-7692) TaxID=889378 RepID=H9UJW1_SPIAZ|nr:hypothetical protein [Spirochaeta africana]AFG37804.1 hypothetical protein Spiaf_1747 [Spirochaeta africana DSM 8902]